MRFARQPELPFSTRRVVLDTSPRAAVAIASSAPTMVPSESVIGGNTFAAKKIGRSFELIGSCMLMAAIVVLALFA